MSQSLNAEEYHNIRSALSVQGGCLSTQMAAARGAMHCMLPANTLMCSRGALATVDSISFREMFWVNLGGTQWHAQVRMGIKPHNKELLMARYVTPKMMCRTKVSSYVAAEIRYCACKHRHAEFATHAL